MSGQYLRLYDYNQQAWVAVSDYARSTRLATFAFDLERYWAAYCPDRPFYPQRASWLEPARSPASTRAYSTGSSRLWPLGSGRRPLCLDAAGRAGLAPLYRWPLGIYPPLRLDLGVEQPFGWATYHYGRWAYSNRLGWVWVPGTQWAPAWVAWRGSEDHLAWAPLPPDAGPGFALDDGYDQIPGYYWQVVPSELIPAAQSRQRHSG